MVSFASRLGGGTAQLATRGGTREHGATWQDLRPLFTPDAKGPDAKGPGTKARHDPHSLTASHGTVLMKGSRVPSPEAKAFQTLLATPVNDRQLTLAEIASMSWTPPAGQDASPGTLTPTSSHQKWPTQGHFPVTAADALAGRLQRAMQCGALAGMAPQLGALQHDLDSMMSPNQGRPGA